MGRPKKARQIDAANMIAGYQAMIADVRKFIKDDKAIGADKRNALREDRIKHYADMITRLQSVGAVARTKQTGSRLLLVTCPSCNYSMRVTMKWISLAMPICPQRRVKQATPILDSRGGYTEGCVRGGMEMEVQISKREKQIIDKMATPEGRAELEIETARTREQAIKEIEEFFGSNAGKLP